MPDKLTDNLSNNSPILSNSLSDSEIKKALECCIKDDCKNCPLGEIEDCVTMTDALDLINRLQAENERLKEEVDLLHSDYTYKLVKVKAKAEAVKEFAERLKEKVSVDEKDGLHWFYHKQIDNLLKEMGVDGKEGET